MCVCVCVRVCACVLGIFHIELFLISSVRLTFDNITFQIVLGVYFYLMNSGEDVPDIGWLPILCLVLYIAVYSIGE